VRIFLTGAKGQLGTDLVERLTASGHELTAVDIDEVDLGMRDDVLAAVEHARPEAIVHPAAFTAVDACESEPDTAFRVNVLGTRHVAEAARRVGAPVTYVSTDYVFDGTKEGPYVEWDTPNPQSVYGRSKLAGERELDPGSTIVRTSWVCGFHGANMVKTILRLAAEPGTLRFVDDQRGHPTFTADLAAVIETLVVERRPGLFHATNQGAVSWYEFARAVLEAAGDDPNRVEPCATADLQPPRPAPRPANSVLDNAALRLSGLPATRDFHEPLAELVARLQQP
jgi:dTDP-4-dehydrorhamnose reductase